MDNLQLILLSIIQGLTEFLPVSSSAHLVLLSELLNREDQGTAFDVGIHFGTLIAAIIYFRSEIKEMLNALLTKQLSSQDNKLSLNLFIAVLPILFIGFLVRDHVDILLRNSEVIAYATILFGLLLFMAQKKAQEKELFSLSPFQAFIIGIFQCFALIPGTSRSGITITAALFMGLSPTAASKFSFLLAIPTIGTIALAELVRVSFIDLSHNFIELFAALLISFLVAYFTIDMFLKLINRIGFTPFVIYRILLGSLILIFWI
ncbi:MAG: undecaprenyl-diphosphate phosphatase [Gammaproteobacteria bacterium]|nr:MAG: undecaprenyl-diphosphate phosphatase [Gammaproteobacteria bacterium]